MEKQINSVDYLQTLLMDEVKGQTVLMNIIRQEIEKQRDYYGEIIEQADESDASLLHAVQSELNCDFREDIREAVNAVLAKIT
jgi:hypothetical protein